MIRAHYLDRTEDARDVLKKHEVEKYVLILSICLYTRHVPLQLLDVLAAGDLHQFQ